MNTAPRKKGPTIGNRRDTFRRTGAGLALTALLVVLVSVSGIADARPSRDVRQTDATPAGTPITEPVSDADGACSTVLAIGERGDACVAFVNAVPDSEVVDFTVADSTAATAIAVNAGDYVDFLVVQSGDETAVEVTDSADPDILIAEASFGLEPDVAYVVVLEQAYDQSSPTLTAVPMDLAPLAADTARVAFHHAVTDAAQLSVLGLDAPSDAEILPGQTTEPVDLAAGDYGVDLVPAAAPDQTLATLDLQLEPDLSYLIIVGGTTGDQTVTVIYAAAPVAT